MKEEGTLLRLDLNESLKIEQKISAGFQFPSSARSRLRADGVSIRQGDEFSKDGYSRRGIALKTKLVDSSKKG
jgi:hypothetical protein